MKQQHKTHNFGKSLLDHQSPKPHNENIVTCFVEYVAHFHDFSCGHFRRNSLDKNRQFCYPNCGGIFAGALDEFCLELCSGIHGCENFVVLDCRYPCRYHSFDCDHYAMVGSSACPGGGGGHETRPKSYLQQQQQPQNGTWEQQHCRAQTGRMGLSD